MTMLHVMCDVTEILQSLSQKFQEICDVYPAAESTILQLESLKHNKGKYMKEFESTLDGKTFHDMNLKGDLPGDSLLQDLVDDLITYIDKRFDNFNRSPLKSFQAFDYEEFAEERSQLASHGRVEIQQLLDHFSPIFPEADHENILNEYTELKVTLKRYSKAGSVRQHPGSDIVKLLEIMLVLSPSTAECERGFSLMNSVKTVRRNCLTQDSLRVLMNIHSAQRLTKQDIDSAIIHWLGCGLGGRHLNS